jgi:predicted NodU family carbamoyl transferase
VHSLAHLFGGLLLDTRLFKNETIVALAVDGGPDFVQDERTKDYWYAGCLSVRGELAFAPVESPGPLYDVAGTLFGKEPGTLMALASACPTRITYDAAAGLSGLTFFGGPVEPFKPAHRLLRSIVDRAREQLAGQLPDGEQEFGPEERLQSAVMKVVQRCCELIMNRNVERLLALGDVRAADAYLATSGGFALNCPANSALMDRYGFRDLLTPPCANDSGQALGLGLLALHGTGAFEHADFRLGTAYHGTELSDTDTDSALSEFAPRIESVEDFCPSRFAADLDGSVVAWADGAAEIGPRALGHRSLLGDPRSAKVKDLLNEAKQRQWWRPVAPIVLAEHVQEWFTEPLPSPYMLLTAQVRESVRHLIPAVTHLDGSARHQTLAHGTNPRLRRAVEAFHAATGVPIVCNTSLNDKGEPVAGSAADVLNFCVRKGVGVAYIAGRRIALRAEPSAPDGPDGPPEGPRPRAVEFFEGQEPDRDAIWRSWRERGYSDEALFLLSRSPGLRTELRKGLGTAHRVNDLAAYGASADPALAAMARRYREVHGPGPSRAPSANGPDAATS